MSKRAKTQAQLKKELDKWFSLYIRLKYAKNGLVSCYTCSKVYPVKKIQNGHFVPRNVLSTRFSEDNCRPQCVGCNMFNRGRPDVFAVKLMKEGVDIEKLHNERYKVFKVDRNWYKEKIEHYKQAGKYES